MILLTDSHIAGAQDDCLLTVSGDVVDEHTGKPIEFAFVAIKSLKKAVYTTERGHFAIKKLCKGPITLTIDHLNCNTYETKIFLCSDTNLTIRMPLHAHVEGEADVTFHHDEGSTHPKSGLTEEQIKKSAAVTLGEALSEINGVAMFQTGSSINKSVVHGMHSNRLLIVNDGARYEGQQWGTEHAPLIDPGTANSISVIKGASAIEYGPEAIGGVIIIEPEPLKSVKGMDGTVRMFGQTNGYAGGINTSLRGAHKKFPYLSWRAQGTLKRGGNVKSPDYYQKNTGKSEANFSWGAGLNKEKYGLEVGLDMFNSSLGIFSGSHIGNLTDLNAAIQSSEPLTPSDFSYTLDRPGQRLYHETFKIKSYYWIGKNQKISVMTSRQFHERSEFDNHGASGTGLSSDVTPESKYQLTTHAAQFKWQHFLNNTLRTTAGVYYQTQTNTSDGKSSFYPDFTNDLASLFLIERYDKNKLTLEAGVRGDIRNLNSYLGTNNAPIIDKKEFQNVSYSLGSIYKFSDEVDIHLNFASAWRAPNSVELYSDGLHHGSASIERGNITLTTERSKSINANVNIHEHDKYSLEITGYHYWFGNHIYLQPTGTYELTIRGAFPLFNYEQAKVNYNGLDINGTIRLSNRFQFQSKYSIVRARITETNEFLPLIPSDRLSGKLILNLKDGKKISAKHVSIEGTNIWRQSRVDDSQDFAPVTDGYFLVHMDAGVSIVNWEFSLGAKNILNTRYREYMDRFRYFTDAMGRNVYIMIQKSFKIKQSKPIIDEI